MNGLATVSTEFLESLGVSRSESGWLTDQIHQAAQSGSPTSRWAYLSRQVLRPDLPFSLHEWAYHECYRDWPLSEGPPPVVFPWPHSSGSGHLGQLIDATGTDHVANFRNWAIEDRAGFWGLLTQRIGVEFTDPYSRVLDETQGPESPEWFPGGRLNIARSCFLGDPGRIAIFERNELGQNRSITRGELERLSGRVASGLIAQGICPGESVGILLPMTIEAVAAILGIILAGCVVVGIPESFAPPEIETRLKLGRARWCITQDSLRRGGSVIPLRSKLGACDSVATITIGESLPGDLSWTDLLGPDQPFEAISRKPSDHTFILFSSGTTGHPKAIPWTQTTPIKCAADGYLYQDIAADDVVAWPSSPGWMMGPWLIFASLVNRASIALFDGHPGSREFCQFVAESGVTTLGLVPSLVAAWRAAGMVDGLDWTGIRRFSSTGECSNPRDMLWLMSQAGYKPVVEYCGGTEIGGAYLTSHPLDPNIPACFNTIAFGLEMRVLDSEGKPADCGEAFLMGPSIGLSTELIDGDHHRVYFEGAPVLPDAGPVRRHGDRVARLPHGFFRVLGRVDDTMNLGGIKVSAIEIERVLNLHPTVRESAAVTEHDPSGGPERLISYVVLQDGISPPDSLKADLQALLSTHLNPLFRLSQVIVTEGLPRTASQKVMRRLLRDETRTDLPTEPN